ncbi:MAG: dihydropteroate synthase [Bacteroidota bacterium]
MKNLQCGAFRLSLERPLVMGIVNLTPDSFSRDGLDDDLEMAVAHARQQLDAGADILDIGAESSRPGAIATPEDEELRRLLPLLERIVDWGVPISVDTYKPAVMRAALAAGATMINDIAGLRYPGALEAVQGSDCAVCVMHMQGEPGSMQQAPSYRDVVAEVSAYLEEKATLCRQVGIAADRIVLDPGFGFGKALEHNLALFRALPQFVESGYPLLVGVSRKTMLGAITGRPVEQRQAASVAAALLAAQKGAKILRVHDVAATRDALAMLAAIEQGEKNE